MKHWIIPSNNNKFRLSDFLVEYGYVDWKQRNNFQIGDIVYIYATKPESKIRFMMEVTRTDMTFEESTTDKEYWNDPEEFNMGVIHNRYCRLRLVSEVNKNHLSLDELIKYGLSGAPQSGMTVSGKTLDYITATFNITNDDVDFLNENIFEGAKRIICVNQYERNPIARRKCLEAKGYRCSVCGITLEDIYGSIGREYIEVHHITPISEIKKSYKINPIADLAPVCPNCHAMLHRGGEGKILSIDELRLIISKNNEIKR